MKTWNLILSEPADAFSNMAIDDAIVESTIAGELTTPTLRFYTWATPSISIGRFQQIKKDIDLEQCEKENISVVRRPTGGRAVFHDKELTYAAILPSGHPLTRHGIQSSYCAISEAFISGLNKLDIPAILEKQSVGNKNYPNEVSCFATTTRYEVTLNHSKIIGSAQSRRMGVILQQGSILFSSPSSINSYFKNSGYQQKGIEDLLNIKLDRTQVQNALIEGFKESLSIIFQEQPLSERLLVRSVQARQYKYLNPQWIFSK